MSVLGLVWRDSCRARASVEGLLCQCWGWCGGTLVLVLGSVWRDSARAGVEVLLCRC